MTDLREALTKLAEEWERMSRDLRAHREWRACRAKCADELRALLAADERRPSLTAEPLQNLGAWPVADVLEILADSCDHLRSDHDCDCHGHERRLYAAQAAREHIKAMRAADERAETPRCDARNVESDWFAATIEDRSRRWEAARKTDTPFTARQTMALCGVELRFIAERFGLRATASPSQPERAETPRCCPVCGLPFSGTDPQLMGTGVHSRCVGKPHRAPASPETAWPRCRDHGAAWPCAECERDNHRDHPMAASPETKP